MIKLKYLIILIIIVAGVGGYYYLQKTKYQAPPEPAPTTQDKFADWKTYRNEEYGFEVKYPIEWYISTEATSRSLGAAFGPEEIKDAFDVAINILTTDYGRDYPTAFGGILKEEIKFQLGNIEATKKYYELDGKPHLTLIEGANPIVFTIEFRNNRFQSEIQAFNQILSTFKFID